MSLLLLLRGGLKQQRFFGTGHAAGVSTANAFGRATLTVCEGSPDIRVQLYHTPRLSPVRSTALYYHTPALDTPSGARSGAGNADGTVTASATAAATAREVGNADGTVTVSGISKATAKEVGNADGTVTVSGISKAAAKEVANADGIVSVSGVGAAAAREVANADGTVTVSGIGAATAREVANADGTVSVSGISRAASAQIGNADGTVTVSGISAAPAGQGTGSADGTSSVDGQATATSAQVGNADGTVTVVGTIIISGGAIVTKRVGWPDSLKRKVPRKVLERLLEQQKNATFGRKWFEEFEAASAEFARTEGEAALAEAAAESRLAVEAVEAAGENYQWEQNRLAATLQTAREVKRTRDILDASRLAVAQAGALREYTKAFEQYQNDNDEEEELLMLIA